MKIKVVVLFGGKSVEHEISIISALQAINSMNTDKYDILPVYLNKKNEMYLGEGIGDIENYKNIDILTKNSEKVNFYNEGEKVYIGSINNKIFGKNIKEEIDLVFPIVHGTNVEDGNLQGYLKTVGVPFVGCDNTSSAVGMEKYITKVLLKDIGIPILPYYLMTKNEYQDIENSIINIENQIGYPVIVKPVNLGSSVGISIAKNRDELIDSIDEGFNYSRRIILEKALMNLREINCSVLGDEEEARASVCEEPLKNDKILSYEDKYMNNSKNGSKGMASVSRIIPAEISDDLTKKIQEMAIKAFKLFGCNGVARIDFNMDSNTGEIYFNEINTIPGSLAFYLWEKTDLSYSELIDKLIELALKRERIEKSITYTFNTNVLNSAVIAGSKGSKM